MFLHNVLESWWGHMTHKSGSKYWSLHVGVGYGACVGMLEWDVSSCTNMARLQEYNVG